MRTPQVAARKARRSPAYIDQPAHATSAKAALPNTRMPRIITSDLLIGSDEDVRLAGVAFALHSRDDEVSDISPHRTLKGYDVLGLSDGTFCLYLNRQLAISSHHQSRCNSREVT